MEASPKKIYIRHYYNNIGAKKKMEKKYYYGNEISQYGIENGRVDYGTLAKCFDAVLNNDIMSLTYDIGYWDQVSGTVDNTDEIEELEEKPKKYGFFTKFSEFNSFIIFSSCFF